MAEKAGIPSVVIVSPQFVDLVYAAVHGQRITSLATSFLSFDVMKGIVRDVHSACETAAEEIVFGLTKWKPPDVKKDRESSLSFEGEDFQDAADQMENFFLTNKLSDGLPLIPPTRKRVDWMLTGTDYPHNKIITDKFGPLYRSITVQDIAVNAVMAGARPEYMPIIMAALDILATDEGLKLIHPVIGSVGQFAPVLIVSGPIARQLNINSSFGLLGPGWQANATIGRTISLLIINGMGSLSGSVSSQSLPGRYTWCFSENERESPWQTMNVESGFDSSISTVTVMSGRGTQTVMVDPPAEKILYSIARAIQGVTVRRYSMPWDQLLILNPAHAEILANAGMSKQEVGNFVFKKALISLSDAQAAGISAMTEQKSSPEKSTMAPMMEKPENLVIVVAGGGASQHSTLVPCINKKVTGEIDKYKPAHWQDLIIREK